MTQFAVVNIERLGRLRLLVANIYDDKSGQLDNQIIVAYEGVPAAMQTLADAQVSHILTSNRKLYGACLTDTAMSAELKHASQTGETARAVADNADILRDLYELDAPQDTDKSARPVGAWRLWIASQLLKIAYKIGGI